MLFQIVVVGPGATVAVRGLRHLVEPEHGIVLGDIANGRTAKANKLFQVPRESQRGTLESVTVRVQAAPP